MAYSRVTKIGDGVSTQFTVNFALDYIDRDHITARVGAEVDGLGNPVYREITYLSTNILQIAGTPAGIGVKVLFERTVPKDNLIINYSNGDVLDEENLDTSQKQVLMVVQEVLDGRFATQTQDFDLGGFKVVNSGVPTGPADLTTKAYVDTRVGNLVPIIDEITTVSGIATQVGIVAGIADDVSTVADIAGDVEIVATNVALISGTASALYMAEDVFVGDGTETLFTLTREPVSEANVDVWVGGAIQLTTDYSVVGSSLIITPPVANGVTVLAKTRVQLSANDVLDARDDAQVAANAAAVSETNAAAAAVAAEEAVASLNSDNLLTKQAGVGAVNRTVKSKLNDLVNVLDYYSVLHTSYSPAINAALTYAATVGQVVQLPPGTFSVIEQISVPNNTGLRGAGKRQTILDFSLAPAGFSRIVSIGTTGITLSEFTAKDGWAGGAASNEYLIVLSTCIDARVERVMAIGSKGVGIQAYSCTDVYIGNCHVNNAALFGIAVFRANLGVQVVNNTINFIGAQGILVDDGTTTGSEDPNYDIVITGNRVRFAGQVTSGVSSILVSGSKQVVIADNVLRDGGISGTKVCNGIVVNSGNNATNTAQWITITGNVVTRHTGNGTKTTGGIIVSGANLVSITGNTVTDNNLWNAAVTNACEVLVFYDGVNSTFGISLDANTIGKLDANSRSTQGIWVGASVVDKGVSIGDNLIFGLTPYLIDAAIGVVMWRSVEHGNLPPHQPGFFGRIFTSVSDAITYKAGVSAWIKIGTET